MIEESRRGDSDALCRHSDYRCKAPKADLVASLTGNYRSEHLFSLRQNFEAYEFLLRQIAACDRKIAARLAPQASACHPTRYQERPSKQSSVPP
jgi:hypothetical protein